MTKVVNINKGVYDVYIGRRGDEGHLGNPIKFGEECLVCGDVHPDTVKGRLDLLDCYKRWFWAKVNNDPLFRLKIMDLKGKRLGCFCKPKPCHGDVIVEWLNAGCPTK